MDYVRKIEGEFNFFGIILKGIYIDPLASLAPVAYGISFKGRLIPAFDLSPPCLES